jgi:hypothetical protein
MTASRGPTPVNDPAKERSNPPLDIFLQFTVGLVVLAHVFVNNARNIGLCEHEGCSIDKMLRNGTSYSTNEI